MIRPDGFRGAAFGTVAEGDLRVDGDARVGVSTRLDIPPDWAYVTQVHGDSVVEARGPGNLGEADGIFTSRPLVPLTVATADCVPIIIEGRDVAAVVHAGWRGAAAGVVGAALGAMGRAGLHPERAALGPAIGPCCYEVGAEVAEQFPGFVGETGWGTQSVDLPGIVASQLADLDVWQSDLCTYTTDDLFSYRRTRTADRQVAVAWLPKD